MSRTAAFFDIDGTIYREGLITEVFKKIIKYDLVNEKRWHQEVIVANANITEYSKVDLQLTAEQIMVFYEKDLAFVAENEDGVITVYCIGQVPENDYVIQATVSEVIVNG